MKIDDSYIYNEEDNLSDPEWKKNKWAKNRYPIDKKKRDSYYRS